MHSNFKIFFLIVAMTSIFMLIGNSLGGQQGMFIALLFAAGTNFFSYWFSDQIILKMYKAKEINQGEFPELCKVVKKLVLRAGIPMPKIFVINHDSPNAFATGRNANNAVVAVTSGLLEIMNEEELTGVIAHELAHVKNKDILIGGIVATMTGAIMMLASMARWSAIFGSRSGDEDNNGLGVVGLILISVLAPIAAIIIQMMISRNREYLADSVSVNIAGKPNGLVNALQKLETCSNQSRINANPSNAHMFIVNPLSGRKLQNLFSTHPPVGERVRKLLRKSSNQTGKGNVYKKSKNIEAVGEDFWNRLNS